MRTGSKKRGEMDMTKKQILFCISVALPLSTAAITIEAPEWVTQVEMLLASLQGIQVVVAEDTGVFQQYQHQLTAMLGNFNSADLQRQRIILAVSNAVTALNTKLATCQSDLAAAQASLAQCQAAGSSTSTNDAVLSVDVVVLQAQVVSLQEVLATLQAESKTEIDQLQKEISSLQDELVTSQQAYANLVSLDGEKAQELMAEINEIQFQFQQMVAARNSLLATLDQFTARSNQYIRDTNEQLQTLVPTAPVVKKTVTKRRPMPNR